MASSDKAESMEVACLGQPFQLGMLYNCHRDQLVRGECFWDSDTLEKCTESRPQKSIWEYKILRENTIESKGELLKMGDDLLLSFLAGMVPVKGSAKFLHDELATSKIQRVALFVQCTDRFAHLQVEKLGSFPSPDIVEDTGATHIVTGITYGVSAFFVFDKTSEDILDSRAALEVKNEMVALIKSIPGELAIDAGKAKVLKLMCTLHSDVTCQKNPNTWDDAVKAYEELTSLSVFVPIKAQLEPLSKYNNDTGCVPVTMLSNKVAVEYVRMLEHLQIVKFDSVCLLECYPVCSYFKVYGKQLTQFQQMVKQYTAKSAKFLQETLPMVRSQTQKENEIANFLKLTSTSPFGATQLTSWLQAKKEEVHHLTGKLQALHELDFAFATDLFFKVINSDDYENVLCLDISLADQDSILISMLDYLSNKTSKYEPEIPWYKDRKEMKHLHDMIKHFKGFAQANRENKHLKCIVSSRSEGGKHCVKINCYEYGLAKEFLPPGPPRTLEAANVTHSSVELTWAEPAIGATNVETYCVSYHRSESFAEKWYELHTKDATPCLLIDNLQPATCYEFKVRAVCAAGYSQESDVKSIKTLARHEKFPRPEISFVTSTSVSLTWSECYEEVMYYRITSQKASSSAVEWNPCGTTQHQETQSSVTVNGLIPNTIYIFKLEAFFKDGSTATSEISEKCQTLCEISFMKPRAMEVTDHSISLEWSPPQHVTEDIESYTIFSCESSEVPCGWTSSAMNVKMNKATIAKLKPITKYVFKVIASFRSSNTVTSEISDGICTTAPSPIEFREPTISKMTHNSAVLVWTKPTGVAVEKYSIYYKCVSQQIEEWHPCGTAQGCDEQATISCLHSGKEYLFKVSASCMNGEEIEREAITSHTTTSIVYLDPPVIVNISDHDVSLMLSKPHGAQEDVQEYSVTYALLDESLEESTGWKSSTATIDSAQKQTTVMGLRSDSTYVFKAKAIFSSGNSVESKPSTHAKTQHAKAKISKPIVSRVNYNNVSLTWSKPNGARVDQYILYKKEHSGMWCACGSVNGSEEESCITGLISATLYVFKVRAVCADQTVIDSEETAACKTKIQFNKPTISGQTCSSVVLSWSKPQGMAERVYKYSISYSMLTQHPKQWISSKEVECTTDETTISGLNHNSSYVFKVTAFFHTGESAISDISDEAQTLIKPKLTKPVVCSVTEKTVSLKWSVPKELHVNHFTVTYQSYPTSSEEWELSGSVRRTDTQMTVLDLVPGTEYKFKVSAVCQNGETIESEVTDLCQMKHRISLNKPQVSKVTESSAFLQWSKPDGARVYVESYSLSYSFCSDASKPHEWTEIPKIIRGLIQGIEIGALKSNSFYVFKIRAVFEDGSAVESEPSDQVQTLQKIEIQPPVVSNVTSNSVSLKWTRLDRVEVKYYSVLRNNLSENSIEWSPCGACKECVQEITIQELKPNTEYVFKIDAVTKKDGKIIESKPSAKCKTKLSLHLNKPNIVKVTCRTVTLGWSEPEGVTEDVQKYSVEYCLLSNPAKAWEQFEQVVNGTVREITVTGLCANSAYILRVKAVFGPGKCITSDASDEILTKSYVLKGPHISDVTENCVELNLTNPEESDISHYAIMYQSTSDSPERWYISGGTVAGHRDHIKISKLNPGTMYSFKVVAHCEDGTKVESSVSTCETQRLVSLNKPRSSIVQENTIILKWTKPDDFAASRIHKYYIAYHLLSASNEEWIKQPIVDTMDTITIPGLKAYTVYNFKIIVLLHSGKEIESPSSECIQTKPPSNLAKPTISSITNHSVLISWSKPEGVCVDKYSIQYRTASKLAIRWHEYGTVQGTDETLCIQRLNPHTGYTFKVIAYYEGGRKIESEISDRCDTMHTLTLQQPRITKITDYSVSLEWIKPDLADENQYQIKNYNVRYCRTDDPEEKWVSQVTSSFNLRTTIFHLSPHREYVFDVTAIMISDYAVQSKATEPIMTKPPCRSGPPKASQKAITEDSIHITWAKPDSCREAVRSYTIVYWKANEHSHNEVSVDCNHAEDGKVVEGLDPQTKYMFKIRANRNEGECYESDEVLFETKGPSGVFDSKLEYCTDNTATISWSKCDSSSRIRCFEISYKPAALYLQKPTEWSQEKTATAEELSVKLKDLLPATMYEYKVHALLKAGKTGKRIAEGIFKTLHPCCPGKPVPLSQTNNSATIKWDKPAYHYDRICAYTVSYQPIDDTSKCSSQRVDTVTENATINDLESSTFYFFVIKPETDDPDMGVCSERSEPIRTKDECRPGKPEILTVRDTSVQLRWAAPGYAASEVEYYEIYYCCLTESEQKWEPFKQLVYTQTERMITITDLEPKTEYVFKIHVVCRGNLVCVDSSCSTPTSTKAEPPAKQLIPRCTLVRKEAPAIYQLPMNIIPLDGNEMLQKCEIGTIDRANPTVERVLMLVGATGAGKTTLVNGITNYILGVSWQHNFRFQLIGDEGKKSQAFSQTQSVTAYTFHKMEGSQLDYTLTIVDTPGFGDTRGLEHDKQIMNLIEQFFSKPGGITFLNGIGFVAQASLPRLTPTQKYIFNEVLGIFGNDAINSISIMATFADGKIPPLYAATDEANLPIDGKYTFNNSALYEDQESKFASFFFAMGAESFRNFFRQFERAEVISLVQTKEVLAERRRLEVTTQYLQKQVYEVLCKMDELRQLQQVLDGHKSQIDQNKDFTVKVTEPKLTKIDLPAGEYTTNCLQCNRTCHESCIYADDGDKYKCWAMDDGGMSDAACRICSTKCHWKQHVNNPFKFIVEDVTVVKTSQELESKYHTAKSNKSKYEDMIINVRSEYESRTEQAYDLVKQVKECLEHLAKIALRPDPLTEEEYIDLLIDTEKREKKPRWKERVESYENLKQRGAMVQKIFHGDDIFEN